MNINPISKTNVNLKSNLQKKQINKKENFIDDNILFISDMISLGAILTVLDVPAYKKGQNETSYFKKNRVQIICALIMVVDIILHRINNVKRNRRM